jgi:hypothetical protein
MLVDYLKQVPDHRRAQGQRFKLPDILLASILAILSGADSYRDIARFMNGRLQQFKEWFGIRWKRAPSKSQIRDILCETNKPALEKLFRKYSQDLSNIEVEPAKDARRFGIDGKALRGSFDHLKGNDILHLLSVFCTHNQLILGHVEIPEKTNEIPTAQTLIKELGLPAGSVYTLDAMHCQKKPLKRSRKRKAN